MSQTTSLHALLHTAHHIIVDGYEIDEFASADGNQLRLSCDEDNSWNFADQQVTLSAAGIVIALDSNGDTCGVELRMERPITLADLDN